MALVATVAAKSRGPKLLPQKIKYCSKLINAFLNEQHYYTMSTSHF